MPLHVQEGDCVSHTAKRFVGVHVGYTRLPALMEKSTDLRGVRVLLPDGSILIASEHNLQKVDSAKYEEYASSIGVNPKSRRPSTGASRQ